MVPRRIPLAATAAAAAILSVLAAGPGRSSAPTHTATAVVETQPADVSGDTVDDAAIWVNPADPAASLVIGSNHKESAVDVYDLSGRRLQRVETKGTNNIDARPGFMLGGARVKYVPLEQVVPFPGGSQSGSDAF